MSNTYAIPPLIPAAKFLPVCPSITAVPPVMYSQPWSHLSATIPLKNALPLVAP